jgi:hypothetical protein
MSTAPGHPKYDDAGVSERRGPGGRIMVVLAAVVVVVALVGALLLGPFGLAVAIPVGIVLFFLFGAASGGTAGGA